MKPLAASILFLVACASAELFASQTKAQDAAGAGYEDARSTASDDEIRVARRAYRSACQETQSADYCECKTASMAQTLAPGDLAIATAQEREQEISASGEAILRIASARSQAESACQQYRRS
jgi:hypothetical protein